jgi:hypothetical protein
MASAECTCTATSLAQHDAALRAGKISGAAVQQLTRQHVSGVPAQVIQLQQQAHRSSMTVAVETQPALCQMPTACHICQLHSYLKPIATSTCWRGAQDGAWLLLHVAWKVPAA